MIFKKIILSTLSAIGLIITASVGQSLVVTSALAIKPCPSPIHPPCCPSPCPVTDSQLRSKFSEANSNILQALELIGGGGPLTSSRSSSPISREQIQNMSWIASQKAVSLALSINFNAFSQYDGYEDEEVSFKNIKASNNGTSIWKKRIKR